MANPTSNFNWQMPTPTDLVTDLPADFEVFGQAVDSSMADLLGGTTGQILAKNSNTNMDFVWITNDVGDITEVAAGTGISGGGTSGSVTITNSMATEITAKGDLIVGTGNAAFDNLPVGTNGHVLTADSTVTPTGVKWAAAPGGGKVLQVVNATAATSISSSSSTPSDTALEATITPTAATSKILVLTFAKVTKSDANAGTNLTVLLKRGATTILTNNYLYTGTAIDNQNLYNSSFLDSPATTSATTYKIAIASENATASVTFMHANETACMTLLEIGA